MPDRRFPLRQHAVEDFARGVGLQISLGHDPGADQAETLPEASSAFGVRVPARVEYTQDMSAGQPVYLDAHDSGIVVSQVDHPPVTVFGRGPVRSMPLMNEIARLQ